MIRAAVTGACGRMGTLIIQNILAAQDIELSAAFDITNLGMDVGEAVGSGQMGVPVSNPDDMENVIKDSLTQVVIDFTIATASAGNVVRATNAGANLVVGTTGFNEEQMRQMRHAISDNGVAAVISPNFAVGVNIFWELLREAAGKLEGFDVEIMEVHHNKKKDAPSGTAVKAAQVINDVLGGREYVYGRKGIAPRGDEIGIHAVRGGDVVGDHTVMFFGDGERIEVRHQAHSRQAFAGGAIRAAMWVMGQPPGVYGMADVLGLGK
ncbi:MAG: 4-hydroxy-tetrahydrodipicolinate reductase [ANME-2 cluster archaeon]|nr:4-hydroxy-tetrahydrodipicolinate reductase [ANME-2 cluster archaeon]